MGQMNVEIMKCNRYLFCTADGNTGSEVSCLSIVVSDCQECSTLDS